MNQSKWTRYDSEAPRGLAVVNMTVYFSIVTTNILILVTFKRMRRVLLQHRLMICLAVVDLLTVLPQLPTMVTLWKGSLSLTKTLTNLISIGIHTLVSATTWLHSAICIEKCCSILLPLRHKNFISKCNSLHVAIAVATIEITVIIAIMTASSFSGYLNPIYEPFMAAWAFSGNKHYFIIVVLPFIVIPLIIALITHILMLNMVRKSGVRRRKRLFRAIRAVTVTVGIYYACWVPLSICIIWNSMFKSESHPQIILWIASAYVMKANSCMNFFIYFHNIPKFRLQLLALFCAARKVHVQERRGSNNNRQSETMAHEHEVSVVDVE